MRWLDSSLICSITSRLRHANNLENKVSDPWGGKLHSFSIGLKGAPDLKYGEWLLISVIQFTTNIILQFKKDQML